MHSNASFRPFFKQCQFAVGVFAAVAILAMMTSTNAMAQMPFRAARTAPATLELTETAGPWMVMCYSFSGDDGKQQAIRLATELRRSFGLKAYTLSLIHI